MDLSSARVNRNRFLTITTPHLEYRYSGSEPTWSNAYLWGPLREELSRLSGPRPRIFEVGCGNGATAGMLHALGHGVVAIDPSSSGVEMARRSHPQIAFAEGSAYDDLAARYGRFPVVVSLEVVEHCYSPRHYAKTVHDLLEEGGTAIISTPYHGYLKNLCIALAGKCDSHYGALWDGGHIKFWSERTLRTLLEEAGFKSIRFRRAGRVGPLSKSMIAIARR